MTDPRTALPQLGLACLIGGVLGLFYGFFRPLRPRHTGAADTLFGLFFCCGWLYWSFGICRGDLHPAGVLGMVLGIWAFDRTVGKPLRGIFEIFWGAIGKLWSLFLLPGKKFLHFLPVFCLFLGVFLPFFSPFSPVF